MGICTVFFTTFPSLPYKCAPIWTCVCACMRAWNWTNDRPTGNAYVQPDLRRHVWCRHIHSDSLSDLFSPSKSTNTSTLLPIAPPSWSTHTNSELGYFSIHVSNYDSVAASFGPFVFFFTRIYNFAEKETPVCTFSWWLSAGWIKWTRQSLQRRQLTVGNGNEFSLFVWMRDSVA